MNAVAPVPQSVVEPIAGRFGRDRAPRAVTRRIWFEQVTINTSPSIYRTFPYGVTRIVNAGELVDRITLGDLTTK